MVKAITAHEIRKPRLLILEALHIKRKPLELRGCPRGVIVKAMDCRIVVREFVLQSRYYVHFREIYPRERYEPPSSYGLNSTTTVLLGEWLWH